MCGRFTLHTSIEMLLEYFNILHTDLEDLPPRYNIAPSQEIFAIVQGKEGNRGGLLKWGLVPAFAKDPKIGSKMINARAETIEEKPSFNRLLKRRRCIIPADGFFEWKQGGETKDPYYFRLKNKKPFGFAGLWDRWENNGHVVNSCTIITTEANECMKKVHHRMPVMLEKDAANNWLDRTNMDSALLTSLLVPFPSNSMESYRVSTLVNYPKHDTSDVLQRV